MDDRDGNSYETVQIGNLIWLKENLRFQSLNAHCPAHNKSGLDCSDGNFYPFEESIEVCPTHWRIPNLEDWENFVSYNREESNLSRLMENNVKKYNVFIMNGDTGFFDPTNILGLKPVGRIEGNKWQSGGIVDFWTNNRHLKDQKFHMHFTNRSIAGHAHKHHIIDKVDKVRKFAVRCVTAVKSPK